MVRSNMAIYSGGSLTILIGVNRKKLAQSEPKLVTSLVHLMDSPSLKVQCQAALALRNLASDGTSNASIRIAFSDLSIA